MINESIDCDYDYSRLDGGMHHPGRTDQANQETDVSQFQASQEKDGQANNEHYTKDNADPADIVDTEQRI